MLVLFLLPLISLCAEWSQIIQEDIQLPYNLAVKGTPGVFSSATDPGSLREFASCKMGENFITYGGIGFFIVSAFIHNSIFELNTTSHEWRYWTGSVNADSSVASYPPSIAQHNVYNEAYNPPESTCASCNLICNEMNNTIIFFGGGYVFWEGLITGTVYSRNEMWEYSFDIGQWRFKGGTTNLGDAGNYSCDSTWADHINCYPAARNAYSLMHMTDNIILIFGGEVTLEDDVLNDLWMYDIANNRYRIENWNSAESLYDNLGDYSVKGNYSSITRPRARSLAASWIYDEDHFYIYSGMAYDIGSGEHAYLKDMWVYQLSTSQWNWKSGYPGNQLSDVVTPSYDEFGVYEEDVIPEIAAGSVTWLLYGTLVFYGGRQIESYGSNEPQQMFQYSVSLDQWRWIGGEKGVYGEIVDLVTPNPKARSFAGSFVGENDKLYFFGGYLVNGMIESYTTSRAVWRYECDAQSYGPNCEYYYCLDVGSNSTKTCLGRGVCVSTDYCDCDVGYAGSNCELQMCFGIYSNTSEVCGGHGVCTEIDSCECEHPFTGSECKSCESGYYGSNCDVWYCSGKLRNASDVCSDHGDCVAVEECDCDPGYDVICSTVCAVPVCYGICGDAANVCMPQDVPVDEWAKGTCHSPDNCTCQTTYFGLYGDQCQYWDCDDGEAHETNVCSGNGYKKDAYYSDYGCRLDGICACDLDPSFPIISLQEVFLQENPDWHGDICEIWTCAPHSEIGIPYTSESVCNAHGNCISLDNCTCSPGFHGESCENSYTCDNHTNYDKEVCSSEFYSPLSPPRYTAGICVDDEECACYIGEFGSYSSTDDSCERRPYGDFGECNATSDCYTGNCKCGPYSMRYDNPACPNDTKGICDCMHTNYTLLFLPPLTNHYGVLCAGWDCVGISAYSEHVCSGRGVCTTNNFTVQTCECHDAYTGAECEIAPCFGIPGGTNGTSACSGHGECVSLDTCECSGLWYGPICNETTCGGISSGDLNVCNGNGECIAYDECRCVPNAFGHYCDVFGCNNVHPDSPEVCSSYGHCIPSNPGSPYKLCECYEGRSGVDCEEYATCFGINATDYHVCSQKGICVSDDYCVCDSQSEEVVSIGLNCEFNAIELNETITHEVNPLPVITDFGTSTGFFGESPGVYEGIGMAPGARYAAVMWTNGSIYIGFGIGYDKNGDFGMLSDFAEFNDDAIITETGEVEVGWKFHLHKEEQKYIGYSGYTEEINNITEGVPSARAFASGATGSNYNVLYIYGGFYKEGPFDSGIISGAGDTLYAMGNISHVLNLLTESENDGLKNDLWGEEKIEEPPNARWVHLSGDPKSVNTPIIINNETDLRNYSSINVPGGKAGDKLYVKNDEIVTRGGYGYGIESYFTGKPSKLFDMWAYNTNLMKWRFVGINYIPDGATTSQDSWNGNEADHMYGYGGASLISPPSVRRLISLPSVRREMLADELLLIELVNFQQSFNSLFYSFDLEDGFQYVLTPAAVLKVISEFTSEMLLETIDIFSNIAFDKCPPPLVFASSWFYNGVFYVFGGFSPDNSGHWKTTNARFKLYPEIMQSTMRRSIQSLMVFDENAFSEIYSPLGMIDITQGPFPPLISPKNCDRLDSESREKCDNFVIDCTIAENDNNVRCDHVNDCHKTLQALNISDFCDDVMMLIAFFSQSDTYYELPNMKVHYDTKDECMEDTKHFLHQCQAYNPIDIFSMPFSLTGLSSGGTLLDKGVYLVQWAGIMFANLFLPTNKLIYHQVYREPICFGVSASQPSVCSGRGACIADETCICDSGWEDSIDCSTPVCYGEIGYLNDSCSGRGECMTPDYCNCQAKWTGIECDIPYCSPPCVNGDCVYGDPDNACNCTNGWEGSICQTPICIFTCLNGGSCVGPNECTCLFGYHGEYCAEIVLDQSEWLAQIASLNASNFLLQDDLSTVNNSLNLCLFEKSDLIQQISNLGNENNALNGTIQTLLQSILVLNSQLADSLLHNELLNSTIHGLLLDIQLLTSQVEQLLIDNGTFNATILGLLEDITILTDQIADLILQIGNQNITIYDLVDQVGILTQQILDRTIELSVALNQIGVLNNTISDLLDDITFLTIQLADTLSINNILNSTISTLTNQLSDCLNLNKFLNGTISSLSSQLTESIGLIFTVNNSLNLCLFEKSDLIQQISNLGNENNALNGTIQTLLQNILVLNSQLAASLLQSDLLNSTIQGLLLDIQLLTSQVEQLLIDNGTLNSTILGLLQDITILTDQIADLLLQIGNQNITIYDLVDQVGILTQQILDRTIELSVALNQIGLLNNTISDLLDDITFLTIQLTDTLNINNILNATISTLTNQLADCLNLNNFLNGTISSLNSQLTESIGLNKVQNETIQILQFEIISLNSDNNALNGTIQTLLQNILVLNSQLVASLLQNDLLNSTIQGLLLDIQILTSQVEQLSIDNETANAIILGLLQDITILTDQIADLLLQIGNQNITIYDLVDQVGILTQQVIDLTSKLSVALNQIELLNNTISDLLDDITFLTIQLTDILNLTNILNATISFITTQLADCSNLNNFLNGTVSSLTSQLTESVELNEVLNGNIQSLLLDVQILTSQVEQCDNELGECRDDLQNLQIGNITCQEPWKIPPSCESIYTCNGIEGHLSGVCGIWSTYKAYRKSHGVCRGYDICKCFEGWTGDNCKIPVEL